MNRRTALLALCCLPVLARPADDAWKKHRPERETPEQVGPVLGDVTLTSAQIGFRAAPGDDAVRLAYGLDDKFATDAGTRTPEAARDRNVRWSLTGLSPQTAYAYRIENASTGKVLAGPFTFWTARADYGRNRASVLFGSCADERPEMQALWALAPKLDLRAVALIGDTPYIDSTDPVVQRIRHRDFLGAPGFSDLVARVPLYSVWDDHDYGADNADGRLAGKENSLAVFRDYRVNPSYGDGASGLYHKFSVGLAEYFMLDTRYFAGLEKNPDVPGADSALGAAQWRWLTEGLVSSRAPFKVIVSGMIWHEWNDPKKRDVWVSYRAERDALFSFIGKHAVGGVVLVGGDVHQSGLVKLPTTETAGYPIHSFTVSPLSAKVHSGPQFPEQDRIFLIQQPHVFLILSAIGPDEDGDPTLEGLFMNAKGERLLEKQVRLKRASPPKRRN